MNVWELDLSYTQALRDMDYDKFVHLQSEIAIKHIFNRLTHSGLRGRIKLTYKLRKKELKEDYAKFMRQLAEEARTIDRAEAANKFCERNIQSDSDLDDTRGTGSRSSKRRGKRKKDTSTSARSALPKGKPESGDKSSNRSKPSCLNPNCNEEHFIRDCP